MAAARELQEYLLQSAISELHILDSSDEQIDYILDALNEDLNIASLFRYTYRSSVPKNLSWFDRIVPNYDAKGFRMLFRCNRQQFKVILNLIQDNVVFNGINSEKQFTVEFQLALVLYRLGSSADGATVFKIATLFGIGDGGSIDKITRIVFASILTSEQQFLSWATEGERARVVLETINELPYCIGYVDGTEIPLEETSKLDPTSYYSRNKQYCIQLQAMHDFTKKIRQITVGYPGSARIYNDSGLARNPAEFFTGPQWLAADSAYRLTTTVMTPFRSNATCLTAARRTRFNKYFSSYRVRIEHSFGILKEKLPSLKSLKNKSV